MAKRLALVDVRDVHLDHGAVKRVQRIKDRHRSVRLSAGIQDDGRPVQARLLDPVDQLAFVVGL